MSALVFYFFFSINWVITLLPLRILYLFSDVLYVILYYFPSYRRSVVRKNLERSFPEKTKEDLIRIEKKFYQHLADLFVEILKLTHMSNKELRERFSVSNPEVIEQILDSGRDVMVVHSHYNNWEWLGACYSLYSKYKLINVYKPLHNRLFDQFLNNLRTRNEAEVVSMNNIARKIIENRNKQIRAIYGFVSDQTPAKPLIRYWTNFLNQETPVFTGAEKISTKYDMSIVFFNVQKIKRGYYNLDIELLYGSTVGLPEFQVTETHVRRLEKVIKDNPEYWIWTHRRWKYKKPVTNA